MHLNDTLAKLLEGLLITNNFQYMPLLRQVRTRLGEYKRF